MFELCYTSLPRGLVPGTSGYTTVGQSPAMSRWLVEQAESLSSFHFLNEKDPNAYFREPVNIVHVRVNGNRQTVHIVSRIAACQPDHTGRSNYFAHHTLLAPQEALPCKAGPAELAASVGFLMTEWTGEARVLPVRAAPAIFDRGPTVHAIEAAGLDLGWGPALADRLRDRGVKQTYLVYSLGTDMLGIVGDVLSNLPPDERWQATFATHATKTFPGLGVDCRLQCVVANTPYAQEVLSRFPADTFDLTKRSAPPPRRAIATDSGSSVGPRSAGGKPSVALVRSGRLPQTGAVTTSAQAYDDFGLSPYQKITIAQPPSQSDRQGQFGWPAILIPSVLSLAMAIGCGVLGYQWLLACEQVSRLKEKNGRLEDTNKKSKEELAKSEGDVERLKKELRNPEKEGRAASAEKKPEPQPIPETTAAAQEKVAVVASPMKGDAADAATPAAPQKDSTPKGPTSSNVEPPQLRSESRPPSTEREAAGPRVGKDVADLVEKAMSSKRGKLDPITLVDNLTDPPASHGIEVTSCAGEIVEPAVKQKGLAWDVTVMAKKVATIKFDNKSKSLVLELVGNDKNEDQWLAQFLRLSVSCPDSQEKLHVALGSPMKCILHVATFSDADKSRAGADKFEKNAYYKLFTEEQANEVLKRTLRNLKTTFPDRAFCESFDFAPDSKLSSKPATGGAGTAPAFTLRYSEAPEAEGSSGVRLKRKESFSQTYTLSGYQATGYVVDPLQCRPYCNYENDDIFNEDDSRRYADAVKKVLAAASKEKIDLINAAMAADKIRFNAGLELLKKLQGKKVRLTLKMPDSDDGFVIVDSLGSPDGN